MKKKVDLCVKSKVTKRPHLQIMAKIKNKIGDMIKEKMGAKFGTGIMSALQSTTLDGQIKELMEKDKVQIVNQSGKPVYGVHIKTAAAQNSEEYEDDEEAISPGVKTKKQLVRHFILTFVCRKSMMGTSSI